MIGKFLSNWGPLFSHLWQKPKMAIGFELSFLYQPRKELGKTTFVKPGSFLGTRQPPHALLSSLGTCQTLEGGSLTSTPPGLATFLSIAEKSAVLDKTQHQLLVLAFT